jgi:hypothetical protein
VSQKQDAGIQVLQQLLPRNLKPITALFAWLEYQVSSRFVKSLAFPFHRPKNEHLS